MIAAICGYVVYILNKMDKPLDVIFLIRDFDLYFLGDWFVS